MADVTNINGNNQATIENQDGAVTQEQTQEIDSNSPQEVTIESLMAKVAALEAENKKTKTVLDKTLKEKGDITKQYRDVLTEAQQAKIDQENADEEHRQYVADLELYKKTAEAKNRYLVQHMDDELATRAAEAEISGDMDALAAINAQHLEMVLRKDRQEQLASRPQPQVGVGGDSEDDDAFLKGFNSVSPRFRK